MSTGKDDFSKWLLDNADTPEADAVMRKIYETSASGDRRLAEDGYAEFASRTGLSRGRGRRLRRTAVHVAAALSLPAIVLSIWALMRLSADSPEWVQVSTAYSETRQVLLPDGSTVTMSPCSQLFYPESFRGRRRDVMLVGEAFMDVARDRRHRFVVSAGGMEVVVHGTKFNVSSFPDGEEDEVALVEGSVEMRLAGRDGSIFLAPGEMIKYDKATGTVHRRHFAANYFEDVVLAGGMQFRNERLTDIVSDLSRQFNVNIVIEDPSLASERYYASFINGEGVDDILSALNTGGHFRVSRRDSVIYLTK